MGKGDYITQYCMVKDQRMTIVAQFSVTCFCGCLCVTVRVHVKVTVW